MKKIKIIMLILLSLNLVECLESKNIKKLPKFENPVAGGHIIRYSNVILKENGKRVKVPIYGGIYGDITYEDLIKQQKYKDNYLLSGIGIYTKHGTVKKTFYDFLKFYKKSLFKNIDINKPSVIGSEGSAWQLIWYDFEHEGLPCSMFISIECDEKKSIKKIKKMTNGRIKAIPPDGTIDMLEFNEKSKGFGFSIYIGKHSPFYKGK